MVFLKPQAEYTPPPTDPSFRPGPRNGHLSAKDPGYAALEPATEALLAPMWGGDVPLPEFKRAWAEAPPALPAGCPGVGTGRGEVVVEDWTRKIKVRDGGEVGVRVYRNPPATGEEGKAKAATLVFRMHGGGWTVGSHGTEEAENRYLGALEGAVVVSVDYRMAPEFPFPTPIEDAYDVLKWCHSNPALLSIDPSRTILAGNSGGGNMALAVALMARDDASSPSLFRSIVAVSTAFPVTCHPTLYDRIPGRERYELLSYTQNYDAGVVSARRMEFFWDAYVGRVGEGGLKPDKRHSPLLEEDLSGMPPLLIQVAGLDPLRDDGIAFAEAARAAGNEVELHTYAGLPHCFYMFTGLGQTALYYERCIGFVKRYVDGGK